MSNSWFRVYAEFATDPKVQSMSEAMQRRLMMLMCLRCSDVLATLQDDEIAFALRLSDEELSETKVLFVRKGFIDEGWNLTNWDKRQFVSDTSTERSRKHREKKKQEAQHACNVAATPPDTDTDTDTDKKTPPKSPRKRGASQPAAPSLSIVDLQALGVDADVATEFLALRQRKRAALTEIALAGIRREADSIGWTLDQALRKCVERGWQGFDAGWVQNQRPATASGHPVLNRQEALEERNREIARRWAEGSAQ